MDPEWWEKHIERTANAIARTRQLAISVLEATRGHPFTRLAVGGQSNQEHDYALAALFDRPVCGCVGMIEIARAPCPNKTIEEQRPGYLQVKEMQQPKGRNTSEIRAAMRGHLGPFNGAETIGTTFLQTKAIGNCCVHDARSRTKLAEFPLLSIEHISGKHNEIADMLSRSITQFTEKILVIDTFAGCGTLIRALDQVLPWNWSVVYIAREKPTVIKSCRHGALTIYSRT